MIRVALCERDREERERICSMLNRYRLSTEITEYDASEALFWDMETDGARYDLCFLPSGGAEISGRLRSIDGDTLLIFLSEGSARRGEETDGCTLGSVEKPVEEKALCSLLEKAAERLRRYKRRVMVITQRSHTRVLRFDDIEYVSSANHILRFYLRNGEEQTCYGRLDQAASQLDPEAFVRCHQSHVVNLTCVAGYSSKAFHMTSGAVIPISRSYTVPVRKAMEEYLFRRKGFDPA